MAAPRKFFYDTEFLEDGNTIELISIGIVDENGREYYAVNADADWNRVKEHPWLMDNVVPHLPQPHGDWRNHMPKRWLFDKNDPCVKSRSQIRDEVWAFLMADLPPGVPDRAYDIELWAWYGAYDHVVLAQLFGRMIDLPQVIPMWTNDLRQEQWRLGDPPIPEQAGDQHHALADARHLRTVANCLADVDRDRRRGAPVKP